jgi:hypothetical protein
MATIALTQANQAAAPVQIPAASTAFYSYTRRPRTAAQSDRAAVAAFVREVEHFQELRFLDTIRSGGTLHASRF